jgi:glycosyltransferase involved in cell wall biosynthesis
MQTKNKTKRTTKNKTRKVKKNIKTIKFIIIIATFNRKNGKTPEYLKKSIDSVLSQLYTNWDLIIVGDKYEKENELLEIIDSYKTKLLNTNLSNNIIYINNQTVERDKIKNKKELWKFAGANSMNKGLKYARKHNYKYYCHLDDDDYWKNNHLQSLYNIYNKYSNCVFANTQSTYINSYLPKTTNINIFENNLLPTSEKTIHSSISFRIDIIPFKYINIFEKNINLKSKKPADADMLDYIKDFIIKHKQYCSIYNPVLTCYHDIEGEQK